MISAAIKIAELAIKRAPELYDLGDEVEQLQGQLRLIKGVLRDADSKRRSNESIKEWLKEVGNVAYRIEDVVDIFMVEILRDSKQLSSQSTRPVYKKLKTVAKNPLKLDNLRCEIKSITTKLRGLNDAVAQLGLIKAIGGGAEDNDQMSIHQSPFRPTKHFDGADDSEVIGLDSQKNEIINHLKDRSISRRTVLSIVGIGGVGKTTLAQQIYSSSNLEGQFHIRTWLSISQKFDKNDLLRQILYSIIPTMKEQNPPVTDEDLVNMLKLILEGKRYLIILDDVWTPDLWYGLKIALPNENNASRVIITTRSHDVARAADGETNPYKFKCLSDDESLALLFSKALQNPHIQPETHPTDLIEVAKALTTECGNLPLALIVLGAILSRKMKSYNSWSRVKNTLNWHNEDGQKCSNVLAMSYDNLPPHLKPCFLYFAAFPEDHKISARQVKRMWIAEGLISKDGEGTLEDQAEVCLEELVQRCLVQVTERRWNGDYKYCSMHDLLRELAIHEAKETNFFTVISKEADNTGHASSSAIVRRATLQVIEPTKYSPYLGNTHSLLFYKKAILNCEEFRLLKVLVIESVDMTVKEDKFGLEGLIHLRYLGFRNCRNISRYRNIGMAQFINIPFGTLTNLETLDCKDTRVYNSGNIWEVPTLRHVIIGDLSDVHCPLNWKERTHLRNLQTLKGVKLTGIPKLDNDCDVDLRNLKVIFPDIESKHHNRSSTVERWQRLEALLSKASNLVCLEVEADNCHAPFLIVGTKGLRCHESIQSLSLLGAWDEEVCVPCFEMFPVNLTKLCLEDSWLKNDPMPILERLQYLTILRLNREAYEGNKFHCSAKGFPQLQNLMIRNNRNLREWVIEQGAMPKLSQLKIINCERLHTLPDLQKLGSLQELIVEDSSKELYARMQSEDQDKIKHIPTVRLTKPPWP